MPILRLLDNIQNIESTSSTNKIDSVYAEVKFSESEGEDNDEWSSLEISRTERLELKIENRNLMSSFASELSDINKMEQQLQEITQLFDTFNSKVMITFRCNCDIITTKKYLLTYFVQFYTFI